MAFYSDSGKRWHRAKGLDIMIPRHVYDLDVVRDMLIQDLPVTDRYPSGVYSAISRAVRTLIARDHLNPLPLVPMTDYRVWRGHHGKVPGILHFMGGTYLDYGGRRVRFVTRLR